MMTLVPRFVQLFLLSSESGMGLAFMIAYPVNLLV